MTEAPPTAALTAAGLRVGYGDRTVIDGLDVAIPAERLTVIVGPNACGKSTLLRTLARMIRPESGDVLLGDRSLGSYAPKELARRLGMLPQSPIAPDGILVEDLVARGRHPHQSWLRQWASADATAVDSALDRAGVADLRERPVQELSGGQRQRVWIAMVLAQDTDVVLLDEPTTFLDLAHQLEVLDLCRDLQADGRTVVAVLHDLGLAFRYADHLVVMSDGAIVAEGKPGRIVTSELIEQVFSVPCRIVEDPESGTPLVIPRGSGHVPRDRRPPAPHDRDHAR